MVICRAIGMAPEVVHQTIRMVLQAVAVETGATIIITTGDRVAVTTGVQVAEEEIIIGDLAGNQKVAIGAHPSFQGTIGADRAVEGVEEVVAGAVDEINEPEDEGVDNKMTVEGGAEEVDTTATMETMITDLIMVAATAARQAITKATKADMEALLTMGAGLLAKVTTHLPTMEADHHLITAVQTISR